MESINIHMQQQHKLHKTNQQHKHWDGERDYRERDKVEKKQDSIDSSWYRRPESFGYDIHRRMIMQFHELPLNNWIKTMHFCNNYAGIFVRLLYFAYQVPASMD